MHQEVLGFFAPFLIAKTCYEHAHSSESYLTWLTQCLPYFKCTVSRMTFTWCAVTALTSMGHGGSANNGQPVAKRQ